MLLVRKIFLRKKQNRDHTQEEIATKISSGRENCRSRTVAVPARFPNPVAHYHEESPCDARYRSILRVGETQAVAVNLL